VGERNQKFVDEGEGLIFIAFLQTFFMDDAILCGSCSVWSLNMNCYLGDGKWNVCSQQS